MDAKVMESFGGTLPCAHWGEPHGDTPHAAYLTDGDFRPRTVTLRCPACSDLHRGVVETPLCNLGDFSKRIPLVSQNVEAGLIKMSYLGNSGWRSNRASTACIAALPSAMPLW